MRLYSTPESVKNMELTCLALVEILAASSISLFLAWYLGTYIHIAFSICLSPFLLLLTEESKLSVLGLVDKWLEKLYVWLTGRLTDITVMGIGVGVVISVVIVGIIGVLSILSGESDGETWKKVTVIFFVVTALARGEIIVGLGVGVGLGIVVLSSIVIVAIITLFRFMLQPIQVISSIPRNWFKTVFAMDLVHPPRLILGDETNVWKRLNQLRFNNSEAGKEKYSWYTSFLVILMLSILFLPAWVYRLSLKSVFIFYLPLVWVSNSVRKASLHDQEQSHSQLLLNVDLERETKSVFAYIKLIYAVIVIAAAIVSVAAPFLIGGWVEQLSNQNLFLSRWIDYWLFSSNTLMETAQITEGISINLWHITRIMAAMITIYLFYYAEQSLITRRQLADYRQSSAPPVLFWYRYFRAVFSLFTLGCGFYLILWPLFGESGEVVIRWVPW